MNKISQFPKLMGVAINFVIFLPVPWAKFALGHVDLMWPPVRERLPVSYVWPSTVQTTKRYFAKVTIVSNKRREAEIMSNCLHLNIGWAQDYGISSTFATGIQILGDSYDMSKLAKLGPRNGLLPDIEGNWTPSHLRTFADYFWAVFKDTLWHLAWFHWKYKIKPLKYSETKGPSFCRWRF